MQGDWGVRTPGGRQGSPRGEMSPGLLCSVVSFCKIIIFFYCTRIKGLNVSIKLESFLCANAMDVGGVVGPVRDGAGQLRMAPAVLGSAGAASSRATGEPWQALQFSTFWHHRGDAIVSP